MARMPKCWHGTIEVHPGVEGQEGYARCANCGARLEARLAEKPKGKRERGIFPLLWSCNFVQTDGSNPLCNSADRNGLCDADKRGRHCHRVLIVRAGR